MTTFQTTLPGPTSDLTPISVYDKPGLVLSSILNDQISFRLITDIALRPERLTLRERQDLADQILNRLSIPEPTPLTRAVVDTLLNPLTWLLFVTSPVGLKSLSATRRLFPFREQAKIFLQKHTPALLSLHFLTASEALGSGPALEAMRSVERTVRHRGIQTQQRLPSVIRLMERLGVDSLDPSEVPRAKRALVTKINQALFLKAERLDQDVPLYRVKTHQRFLIGSKYDGDRFTQIQEVDRATFLAEFDRSSEHIKSLSDDLAYLRERLNRLGRDHPESGHILAEIKNIEREINLTMARFMREVTSIRKEPIYTSSGKHLTRHAWVRGTWKEDLDAFVAEWGLDEVLSEYRKASRLSLLDTFGKTDLDYSSPIVRDFLTADLDDPAILSSFSPLFDPNRIHTYASSVHSIQEITEDPLSTLKRIRKAIEAEGSVEFWEALGDRFTQNYLLTHGGASELILRLPPLYVEGFLASLLEGYVPRLVRETVDVSQRTVSPRTFRPVDQTLTDSAVSFLQRQRLPMEVLWHPDDLQSMQELWSLSSSDPLLTSFNSNLRRSLGALNRALTERGSSPTFVRTSFTEAYNRYFRDVSITEALFTSSISSSTLQAQREVLSGLSEIPEVAPLLEAKIGRPTIFGQPTPIGQVFDGSDLEFPGNIEFRPLIDSDGTPRTEGVYSNFDVISQSLTLANDPELTSQTLSIWLPAVTGTLRRPELPGFGLFLQSIKQATSFFTRTSFARTLSSLNASSASFIDSLAEWAAKPTTLSYEQGVERGIARYLYITHLGLNGASVLLNLLQPLLLVAPTLGARNTLQAYGDAISELTSYVKTRLSRYGTSLITPAQRREIVRSSFTYSNFEGEDLLGLGDDFAEVLDQVIFGGSPTRLAREPRSTQILNLTMKAFEKSEILNRLVAAHATKYAYLSRGLAASGPDFRKALSRFVEQTQFGQSPLNTPSIFLSAPVASSPLIRQFLTFPLRTVTSTFSILPQLDPDGSLSGFLNLVGRGLALSAIVHEASKAAFPGSSQDRGLFVEAVTDVASLDRITDRGAAALIPIPPIIDIPVGMIQALAGTDAPAFARSLSRLIPGGVGLYKALGASPIRPQILDRAFSTYADWESLTPDGRVPIYSSDGSLVGYQDARTVILRGLGVDMGRYSQQGGIDKILLAASEQVSAYRRSYLLALMNGSYEKASSIAAEYESRFGIPLTITRAHLQAFYTSRVVPRTERILNRTTPDIRPSYAQALLRTPRTSTFLNTPLDPFIQGGTSRDAHPFRTVDESSEPFLQALQLSQ